MYSLEAEETCRQAIKKKCRKNAPLKAALKNKIDGILANPQMFKPLSGPLAGKRRVHILASFVLIYDIDENRKAVRLLKFSHHDEAYI